MTEDICRLCLATSDLVWVFDSRIAEPGHMKEVIHITTGIEIKNTDKVTQNVCTKCCHRTRKMFKFRTTAIKNDKKLKTRLLEWTLKTENTPPGGGQPGATSNMAVKEVTTCMSRNESINIATQKPLNMFVESAGKTSDIPSSNKPHDSVAKLLHKYPQLKIPRSCLKSNLLPTVALDSDGVATWFTKKRKRDLAKKMPIRKAKYKLSSTESPEQVTHDTNIGIDQNVRASLNERVPKAAKRGAPSLEMPPAKRKMSSDIPMRKRKLPSDTMSCSSGPDRDELFSDPDSTAKRKCSDGGELKMLSHNKSTNVNVCTICNAVTNTSREMKLHSRKHTVCPFCKVRFRTIEGKTSHVDRECPIKSIMQNPPAVPLVRVDQVKSLTDKYRMAFDTIHGVSSDDEDDDDKTEILITDDSADPVAIGVESTATSRHDGDGEGAAILDTSKSPDLPDIFVPENNFSNHNIAIGIWENEESIEHMDITVDDDVMYISDDEAGSDPPKVLKSSIDKSQMQLAMEGLRRDTKKTANEALTKLENDLKLHPAVKFPSKCGVKLPSFNKSNDPFLNVVNETDKEASLIRMLLREADMRTGLLAHTNTSITIQETTDKIYALTNIVHYLRRYKMPVDLSFNEKLTVSYEPVKPSRQNKVEIWDPKMALLQCSMIPQPVLKNTNITYHPPAVNKSVTYSNTTKTTAPAGNITDTRLSTNGIPHTGIGLTTNSTSVTGIQLPSDTTPVMGIPLPTNSIPVIGIQDPTNSTPVIGVRLPSNTRPVTGVPFSANTTPVSGIQVSTNTTPVTGIQVPTNTTPVTGFSLSTNTTPVIGIQVSTGTTLVRGIQLPTNTTPVTGFSLSTNTTPVTGIQVSTSTTPLSGIQLPTDRTPVRGIQLPTNITPVIDTQLPTTTTLITDFSLSANTTPVTGIRVSTSTTPVTGNQLPTNNTPVTGIQIPTDDMPITGIQLPTSNAPVTANNVSIIANIENHNPKTANHTNYPGQHSMPTVPSCAQIARVMDASGSPNITCTNSRPNVLNPLLNKSLSRPIVNNGLYNSSNVRTVVTSGMLTPGCYTNAYSARTTSEAYRYLNYSTIDREFNVVSNNIRTPPASYATSVLRTPPPHYPPQSIQRMEDRSLGVGIIGLRVKTADELNQNFHLRS